MEYTLARRRDSADKSCVDGTIDSPGPEGVFRLCWKMRSVYLLWRGDMPVTLIGAGGPGHMLLIEQALAMRGQKLADIRTLLLTHADVTLAANAGVLREKCRALVYVQRLDAPRLALRTPSGEKHSLHASMQRRTARRIGYVPPEVDLYIADGDVIDAWYGLGVVGLPGPTPGHCGFYCRHLNTLFCGALRMRKPTMMERVINPPNDEVALEESRAKVAKMRPKWILES